MATEAEKKEEGAVERCETCAYWKHTGEMSGGGLDENAGICRFKPPQVVVMKIGTATLWPTTMKNGWCKEYAARFDLIKMRVHKL